MKAPAAPGVMGWLRVNSRWLGAAGTLLAIIGVVAPTLLLRLIGVLVISICPLSCVVLLWADRRKSRGSRHDSSSA